jgi:hypothetical protein
MLIPGNGRHFCVLNNLADYFACGVWANKDMSELSGNPLFLFDKLNGLKDPGGALGDMIKAVATGSTAQAYRFVCSISPITVHRVTPHPPLLTSSPPSTEDSR